MFEVQTPLGFRVRVTEPRWQVIIGIKHPVMRGREKEVELALQHPDQVRRSRRDSAVYLFYRAEQPGRWICAVAKQQDGEGFLITVYPTDSIKEGELAWSR